MNHPTAEEIAEVVSGRSTDAQAEAVLSHVETCPDCESVIIDLENSTNEMVERLRQQVSGDSYEEEADCRQFISLAETIGEELSQSRRELNPGYAQSDHYPDGNRRDEAPAHQPTAEKTVPVQIGRFQIQSQLGRGGFGIVLLAQDDELNRLVAIKLPIGDRFKSEDEIQQFIREARTAANLKHPGIVTVYDVGRQDDGTPFVVMEYVDGCTLKDLLKQQRLTSARIVELMIPIVEAVGVAHQQGFVHRDLKPENILIDAGGNPHVADFGLAVHESDQRYRAGEFSGTPCYMAPEQIRGEVHRLDGRADIWALGTVFYEMLTGRRAFGGNDFRQVADEILHRLPKPPRQLDENIPAELQRICLRCCEKDISDRYSSAADIVHDLRGFTASIDDKKPVANLPQKDERAFIQRYGVLLSTVAVIASIIGAVWYTASNNNSDENSTIAAEPSDSLRDTIDVLVWDPRDELRRGIRLQDQDALPLRANDQIRVEAKLSKPAYAYIVWIDSEGVAFPVYPWVPGDWTDRPQKESPVKHVSLPDQVDGGWPMGGVAGMETLLLLVRDSPLPANIEIRQMLVGLPKQTSQHPGSLVWFADGELIVDERDRAPKFFEVQQIDDQVLQTQRQIHESLGSHFDFIRAVSFANRGE